MSSWDPKFGQDPKFLCSKRISLFSTWEQNSKKASKFGIQTSLAPGNPGLHLASTVLAWHKVT